MSVNFVEKLKKLGVEITPEQEKELGGEYISVEEAEKKQKKAEAERDKLKADYETAKSTLEGFEGKNLEEIEAERDQWKQKAEAAEADFKKQIAARDYADLVDKATSDLKFTSTSAKKAFIAELTESPLPVKDGQLLGFSDFVDVYKKNDAGAFVTEAEGEKAQFTTPQNTKPINSDDAMTASLRAVMGLPDPSENK